MCINPVWRTGIHEANLRQPKQGTGHRGARRKDPRWRPAIYRWCYSGPSEWRRVWSSGTYPYPYVICRPCSEICNTGISGLQTQSNTSPLYRGPWDAVKKIYAAHGIAGIYKGQAVTLMREASGYGVYFLTYEKLIQREMAEKGIQRDQISPMNAVIYGAAAGYAVSISSTNQIPGHLIHH